jgi:hypothetical protein
VVQRIGHETSNFVDIGSIPVKGTVDNITTVIGVNMEKRICNKCNVEKPIRSFKKSQSGYRSRVCRACINAHEYKENPDRFKIEAAKSRKNRPANCILKDCRSSDRKRNRGPNDLDLEFIKITIANGCQYCGDVDIRITLDRIDNELPHNKSNVVPCCIRCNYLRGSMPYIAWMYIVPSVKKARELGLFGVWRSKPLNSKYNI